MSTNEGFREIQLNGKQLVFLFMAATVVSVVIFLCGVLVGRGVRADHSAPSTVASAAVAPDPAPDPAVKATAAPVAPAEPPAPADELSYFDRLQKNDTPRERLKPASPAPNTAGKPAPRNAAPPAIPSPKASAANAHPTASSGAEPSGPGFAVQVAAYTDRRMADTVARNLIGKGYPAFVESPAKGGSSVMYRVRVGKYRDRREADSVSERLGIEGFKNRWVTK